MTRTSSALLGLLLSLAACSANEAPESVDRVPSAAGGRETTSRPAAPEATEGEESPMSATAGEAATAYFGAGCFWCVEAVYESLDGVIDAKSGYMGGATENPTYEQVCSGTTGHAEIVRVRYDPRKISFETLLDWFWRLHDPTTLNRQGNDVGTQYRSAIFYVDEAQRAAAVASRKAQEAAGTFSDPIVTEITAASAFYPAEDYHDDYYRLNRSKGYCQFVIRPKMEKLGLEK